jgi:hypothetical protein
MKCAIRKMRTKVARTLLKFSNYVGGGSWISAPSYPMPFPSIGGTYPVRRTTRTYEANVAVPRAVYGGTPEPAHQWAKERLVGVLVREILEDSSSSKYMSWSTAEEAMHTIYTVRMEVLEVPRW